MDSVLKAQALPLVAAVGAPAVAIGGITLFFLKAHYQNTQASVLPVPPKVPGLPVLGNLLQLTEKKPHKTFTKWAEEYGPVYSVQTGVSNMIVLNSNEVAKEAMVARYNSISTRKLTNSLKILSSDKCMVALADYNDFYKEAKRHLLESTLGSKAQKRHRVHRETMIKNVCDQFHAHLKSHPAEALNFRKSFQPELFGLSLKEAIGQDFESIHVEILGTTLSSAEVFKILVCDPMEGAIDVDWRDFFPFLKWIPNKNFEEKLQQMHTRRIAVMEALIDWQKKRIASGEEINCYLDHLVAKSATTLSDEQILMLLWEALVEASDTTLITVEWAMYELSKNPEKQYRLFKEIHDVCGSEELTQEKLCQLPYLAAVFHETLRKHSPVPILPLRYVHEDSQIGGYSIPKGSEIAINIYGCNWDRAIWEDPEEWLPERFLNEKAADTLKLHKTMAFGGGRRVCTGALQAMLISCMAIGRFVQEFEWKLKDGEEDKVDTLQLTSHKLDPLLVNLQKRN